MTFPSGPSGPGFPEQPGFSQEPSFQIQPPVYSHQPGFGQPQPQPGPNTPTSRVTGISAAILAGVVAVVVFVLLLAGIVGTLVDLSNTGKLGEALITIAVSSLVLGGYGLLMLSGARKLHKAKRTGRRMVIVGALLATPVPVIGLAATYTDATRDGHPAGFLLWILVLIYVLATLVLALLPSTGAWIRANEPPSAPKEAPPQAFPPPPGYPTQYPGYPPHHG